MFFMEVDILRIYAMNHWYVLTGGPYAGKTTIIELLAAQGYMTIPEAARAYIEQELSRGKTIQDVRGDEIAFQRNVLEWKENIHQSLDSQDQIFFDRGMQDSRAYFDTYGAGDDRQMLNAMQNVSYKKVFLLDMISYERDGVRTETLEDALRIHTRLGQAYEDAGMSPVRVPVLPPQERMEFILSHVSV